jgi:hypothetical protein
MAPRWLIAVTAILTLSGISSLNAPAMAREDHPHPVHVPARNHSLIWRRSASPREAAIRHATRDRAMDVRHRFQSSHHETFRR